MDKFKKFLFIIACLFFAFNLAACANSDEEPHNDPPPKTYLRDFYEDYFPVGAALNSPRINKCGDVLPHYSSITAESEMKWLALQPSEGSFIWDTPEKDGSAKLLSMAKEQDKQIRGHALCWYKGLPSWVLEKGTTKQQALSRLRIHIDKTVKHFGNEVYCWDVVNEAISNAPTTAQVQSGNFYRTGSEATGTNAGDWYAITGKDYIKEAFVAAKTAVNNIGANIKLYYNDYGLLSPAKRDAVVKMVSELRSQGVTVDGIGMQAHYKIATFNLEEFEKSVKTFTDMGLDVQLTELDLSVYSSASDAEYNTLPQEVETRQAEVFANIFGVMRRYSTAEAGKGRACGITFWGVADDGTWLDNYPVTGRKDYPLLFDTQHNPKLGYYEVTQFGQTA